MRKIVFIAGCLTLGLTFSYGQQVPLYSLYHQNQFLYNPARTGFNDSPEAYFIYRKQWIDFDGAPETRALSFDMPVKKAGVGAYVFNDISDIFNRWGGYFSYAYHLKFNDMHKLSLGLAAGIQQLRIDVDNISVKQIDDPVLMNDLRKGTSFDGSAGIHYFVTKAAKGTTKTKSTKSKGDTTSSFVDTTYYEYETTEKNVKHSLLNLSIGGSAQSVYSTDLEFLNDNDNHTYYRPERHYIASVYNTFKLIDEKLILEPMVMARLTEAKNYQIDAGLLIGYRDWAWVSGTYRYDYAVTIGGGFKVHDAVKIGYAYDLALNELKDYTNGTHEIMLGVVFGKRTKDEDWATKAALDSLKEQVRLQDSVFTHWQYEQDSIINGLRFDLDSLNELMASGEWFLDDSLGAYGSLDSMTMGKRSELAALEARIKELEDQIQDAVNQLDIKVKDLENEMTEERTRFVSEEDLEVKRGPGIGDYFMVVGSFRIEQNSYNFQEDLKRRGYEAGVVYDKKRKWYYTYIAQPKDLSKGLEDLYKLREEVPEFHDAWIHIMSKSLR